MRHGAAFAACGGGRTCETKPQVQARSRRSTTVPMTRYAPAAPKDPTRAKMMLRVSSKESSNCMKKKSFVSSYVFKVFSIGIFQSFFKAPSDFSLMAGGTTNHMLPI